MRPPKDDDKTGHDIAMFAQANDPTTSATPAANAPALAAHWIDGRLGLLAAAAAAGAFNLSFQYPELAFLVPVWMFALVSLAHARTKRLAFALAALAGVGMYAPQLWFFVDILGPLAAGLWLLLAGVIAVFALLGRWCLAYLPRPLALVTLPFLWTGLEYFRGEMAHLRFTWLSAGYALWPCGELVRLDLLGVYGLGFVLMLGVCGLLLLPHKVTWAAVALAVGGLAVLVNWPQDNPQAAPAGMAVVVPVRTTPDAPPRRVDLLPVSQDAPGIAVVGRPMYRPPQATRPAHRRRAWTPLPGPVFVGVQLEDATVAETLAALDAALARCPQADVLVLGEYAFPAEPPPAVRDWCRLNEKYLIAGGVERLNGRQFYNTAFVLDRRGSIVHRQAKSVPVPFFRDGEPAPARQLWQSPWGPIGVCICYDMSYRRVMDDFVRQGARLIVIPTMDRDTWGPQEHLLHSRVTPVRSSEYGVPIFRVCSSGISQAVDRRGRVVADLPQPGQGQVLAASIAMDARTTLPADHAFGPAMTVATGGVTAVLLAASMAQWIVLRRRAHRRGADDSPPQGPTSPPDGLRAEVRSLPPVRPRIRRSAIAPER